MARPPPTEDRSDAPPAPSPTDAKESVTNRPLKPVVGGRIVGIAAGIGALVLIAVAIMLWTSN